MSPSNIVKHSIRFVGTTCASPGRTSAAPCRASARCRSRTSTPRSWRTSGHISRQASGMGFLRRVCTVQQLRPSSIFLLTPYNSQNTLHHPELLKHLENYQGRPSVREHGFPCAQARRAQRIVDDLRQALAGLLLADVGPDGLHEDWEELPEPVGRENGTTDIDVIVLLMVFSCFQVVLVMLEGNGCVFGGVKACLRSSESKNYAPATPWLGNHRSPPLRVAGAQVTTRASRGRGRSPRCIRGTWS